MKQADKMGLPFFHVAALGIFLDRVAPLTSSDTFKYVKTNAVQSSLS
jgi:hypothetical protein